MTGLITLLLEAREEKKLLRFRKHLKQLDQIILDELGYVPTEKARAELLFEGLSTAYERQSVIGATNLPFEQWTEGLGNERLTGATLAGSRTAARSWRRRARASASATPENGDGGQLWRPEPSILGATGPRT